MSPPDSFFHSTRWIIRSGELVTEFWFNKAKQEEILSGQPAQFLIMCHGCPSHPFDHNPALLQQYLETGMILVYPSYLGTWASDGGCTLANAVDSVLGTIDLISDGSGAELRHGTRVSWKAKEIVTVGASFGGAVSLIACAKSDRVLRSIAISPVTDFRTHNRNGLKEEDLLLTWNALDSSFRRLWRLNRAAYDCLIEGTLDLNVVDYIERLRSKTILLIHSKGDTAVSVERSRSLHRELDSDYESCQLLITEHGEHLLLFHLGEPALQKQVFQWLQESVPPINGQ